MAKIHKVTSNFAYSLNTVLNNTNLLIKVVHKKLLYEVNSRQTHVNGKQRESDERMPVI
jgi:hypothetical protein